MPDTPRTRSELVAALADNTRGAITAQTMRDWLASGYLAADVDGLLTEYQRTDAATLSLTSADGYLWRLASYGDSDDLPGSLSVATGSPLNTVFRVRSDGGTWSAAGGYFGGAIEAAGITSTADISGPSITTPTTRTASLLVPTDFALDPGGDVAISLTTAEAAFVPPLRAEGGITTPSITRDGGGFGLGSTVTIYCDSALTANLGSASWTIDVSAVQLAGDVSVGGGLTVDGDYITGNAGINVTAGPVILPTASIADSALSTLAARNAGFKWPGVKSQDRLLPAFSSISQGGTGVSASSMYVVPILVRQITQFDRVGLYLNWTAANSGSLRFGVWDVDSNGLPGALISDFGTAAYSASFSGELVRTITWTPSRIGWYYLGVVYPSTPPATVASGTSVAGVGGGYSPSAWSSFNTASGFTVASQNPANALTTLVGATLNPAPSAPAIYLRRT